MEILLLGAQGAGKGTQAKRIRDEYDLPHIATGDILRAAIAAETELGLRVKPILESGALVPDELMIDLIRERLGGSDASVGFILDGFPRTLAQAEALDAMLVAIGRKLAVVFELQLDEQICVDRMLARSLAEGRVDDTPDVIQRRLALYHEATLPVVEHYRATGRLVGIHADRTVNEVFAEIQDTLERVAA